MYEMFSGFFILFSLLGWAQVFLSLWSRSWPTAMGMVTDAVEFDYHQAITTDIRQRRVILKYEYEVKGDKYLGSRISVGVTRIEKKYMATIFPNGVDKIQIPVRYCPFWPRYAVIAPDFADIKFTSFISILFAALGIYMILAN
jgi:hypothetical protein